MTEKKYSYAASAKSGISDEFINTYLIRPIAGIFVRILFFTSITPNHVTLLSMIAGFIAADFYLQGTPKTNIIAGLCISLKDVLDSADGQLARAKQQFSRAGRFLDSIGDFLVNLWVFTTITLALFSSSHSLVNIVLGFLCFVGTTLRVSYHVFYQTSFLHLHDAYSANRVTEEIRDEDLHEAGMTLTLQRIFQLLYGWQDKLMVGVDDWCRSGLEHNQFNDTRWYGNVIGLRISGLLGLGTELFLLTIFSVVNRLEEYLWVNVLLLNGVWIASIIYRKYFLAHQITPGSLSPS